MSGKTSSPTIADVAREAGVSITTVSRYLNGSSLIAEDTIQHVREAIVRLGYLPRSAARNLALRRTNTLGVLMESIGTSFFASVVAGAEEEAYKEGYSLLIATPGHMNNGTFTAFGPNNTDGLLVVNIPLSRETYRSFQPEYPIVTLYQPAPRPLRIPLISVQNKRGTFQAVEHLIKVHGLSRIAFLRGPKGNADSHWREVGYRQAMRKYGLPVDEAWIGDGEFSYPGARKTLLAWMHSGWLPEAIFTGNDEAALDVMLTLYRLGIRVPEDVALIGFDDLYLAPSLVPPLTTVRAPIHEVGREGVRKLLQLIRTGEAEPVTLMPTELVVRRSCGCTSLPEPDLWPTFDQVQPLLSRQVSSRLKEKEVVIDETQPYEV